MTYPRKERNGRWYELRNGRWHRDERAFRSAWAHILKQYACAGSIDSAALMRNAARHEYLQSTERLWDYQKDLTRRGGS